MRTESVVFELNDGEIKAFWFSPASYRKQGHSSNVVRFDCIPIPTGVIEQGKVRDESALITLLLKYRIQYSRKLHKAYLAIPLQQGFIQAYSLPWLPRKDRQSAISLLVDEEISIARSDLLYDFVVTSEEKHKNIEILLGAIRQSILQRYVSIFGEAGFKIQGVDFSFSILGQALGLGQNEDVLYLRGDSDCFQMVLFRGTVPQSVRTMQPLPSSVKNSTGVDEEGTRELINERENEIGRFLLYYRTQQTDLNLNRLVWSGDVVVSQMAQRLLASNHVSVVEQAKLNSVPSSWLRVFEDNEGKGEVVIGYGLGISTQRQGLNLWRQSITVQTIKRKYQGLAVAFLALLLLGTIIWGPQYSRVLFLRQEVEQLSEQGAGVVAQAKHQEDLERAWQKVTGQSEGIGASLAQINDFQSTGLKLEHITYEQGNLSLRGSALDAGSVQTLMLALRGMGWEQPALSSYQLTSLNKVEFSLSARRKQAGAEVEHVPE